jgi:Superfamily II DNA helicase
MNIFKETSDPIFLKDTSDAYEQLEQLKILAPTLSEEGKRIIKRDISLLEYGIRGEENILFELKNSHIPIIVLRDMNLEHNGLTSQIDFLIFTGKICFIVECKNLYGDITVNNRGEFTRTMKIGTRTTKEGIYSPVTQNQRHFDLIWEILMSMETNFLKKKLSDVVIANAYKPVVVFANPKGVLNVRYAKRELKEKVIRADSLVQYIIEIHNKSVLPRLSRKEKMEWAKNILSFHNEIKVDYLAKYGKYKIEKQTSIVPAEETQVYQQLKEYRLATCRKEKIEAYLIFNNKQLLELVEKLPKTDYELKEISGFDKEKVSKYGKEILQIIKVNTL